MKTYKTWMHGTQVYFTNWTLPLGRLKHKGGLDAHSAIFFTTDKEFALGAAQNYGGLCSAQLLPSANVLDMNSCSASESENYRVKCSQKKMGRQSPNITYQPYWVSGWKTGRIMKYVVSTESEANVMKRKVELATTAIDTPEGIKAFNEIQLLTRQAIEELVISAKELGYDAVIGNEIDTLHPSGQKTYRIMFVINHKVLSPPTWLGIPIQD
jgi:uncharacterized protein YbjQ (UPF0145 family)